MRARRLALSESRRLVQEESGMAEMGPRSVSNIVFIVLLAGALRVRRHGDAEVHLGGDRAAPTEPQAADADDRRGVGASSTPPSLSARAVLQQQRLAAAASGAGHRRRRRRPARSSSGPARRSSTRSKPSTLSGGVSGSAAPVFSASRGLAGGDQPPGEVQHRVVVASPGARSPAAGGPGPSAARRPAAAVKPPIGAALVQGIGVRAAVAAGAAGVGGDGERVLQPLERHVAVGQAELVALVEEDRAAHRRSAPPAARGPCAGRCAPCGSGSG